MKQFLHSAMAVICLFICVAAFSQDNPSKAEKTKKKLSAQPAAMVQQSNALAYTPTYSAQFAMGNPAHSQTVLNLIKDYETKAFALGSAFSDTVMVVFPDGNMVRGLENMTNAFKQARTQTTDPKISISAAIPVRATDKKEDWVLVWGSADEGGTRSDFHHIWRFNKDGKIDYMQMFEGKPPKQQ